MTHPAFNVRAAIPAIDANTFIEFTGKDWKLFEELLGVLKEWFKGDYMGSRGNHKDMYTAVTFLNNVVPFTGAPPTLYRSFWVPGPVRTDRKYKFKTSIKPMQSWTLSLEVAARFYTNLMYAPTNYKKKGLVPVVGEAKVGKYALTSMPHLRVIHQRLKDIANDLYLMNATAHNKLNEAVTHLERIFHWEMEKEVIVNIPNNSHVEVKIIYNM